MGFWKKNVEGEFVPSNSHAYSTEPEPELIDVTVVGKMTYGTDKEDEEMCNLHNLIANYYAYFKYDVTVTILGEEIKCEGSSNVQPKTNCMYGGKGRVTKEDVLHHLADILVNRKDDIMDGVKSSIINDVKRQLKAKKLKELEEKLLENKEIEINLNFQIDNNEFGF